MSKPRYFSPIPTVSIHFPFLSHTYLPVILSSAFSLSKFRISVRGWQRLSMSSIKKKKKQPCHDEGQIQAVVSDKFACCSPSQFNGLFSDFCATYYTLPYYVTSIRMLSDLVFNLAMCLSGGTAALLQHSSPSVSVS